MRVNMFLYFFVINSLLIFFQTYTSSAETIFDKMATDTSISKFTELMRNEIKEGNPLLTDFLIIFAPSNDAIGEKKIDQFVKNHYFGLSDKLGTVDKWDNIGNQIGSLRAATAESFGTCFLYSKDGKYYYNNGLLTKKDNVVNKATYHVIDRVMYSLSNKAPLDYMKSLDQLKVTNELFKLIVGEVIAPNKVSGDKLITMFLPIDEAWSKIGLTDMDNLKKNPNYLKTIIDQYVVLGDLHFLREENIEMVTGFSKTLSATYKYENGKGVYSSNNYKANIVQSNMVIRYGVIHLIDGPLISFETVEKKIRTISPNFYKLMLDRLNLTQILTERKRTVVLIPSDTVFYEISSVSDTEVQRNLLGLLILDFEQMTSAIKDRKSGAVINSYNNRTYVLRVVTEPLVYLDLKSQDNPNRIDLTWQLSGKPSSLNNGDVYSIEGLSGLIPTKSVPACSLLLPYLDRDDCRRLIYSYDVDMAKGSPYVLLAPSNEALSAANVTKFSRQYKRYLIQRHLLPLVKTFDLWTLTETIEPHNSWTMNYAATKETIQFKVKKSGNVTVSFEDVSGEIAKDTFAYRCYGSEKYKDDRSRDITVYPIDFVLISKQDKNQERDICVAPPCSSCSLKISRLVVIATVFMSLYNFFIF